MNQHRQRKPLLVALWIALVLSARSQAGCLLRVDAFGPSAVPTLVHLKWSSSWIGPRRGCPQTVDVLPAHATASPFRTVPSTQTRWNNNRRHQRILEPLKAVQDKDSDGSTGELEFHVPTALGLVAGQSVLILVAVGIAWLAHTPGFFGLGSGFSVQSRDTWQSAILATLPLGGLAVALDLIEDSVPALQQVTKATQRSVLTFMGSRFLPLTGLVTATALGIMAGVGEEWLFRGVLQTELENRVFSSSAAILGTGGGGGGALPAVLVSSVIFGALHAVTPLYAILATLASVYFGFLYVWSDNLAVPMLCHGLYDIVALYYAHWTVAKELTPEQRSDLLRLPL